MTPEKSEVKMSVPRLLVKTNYVEPKGLYLPVTTDVKGLFLPATNVKGLHLQETTNVILAGC